MVYIRGLFNVGAGFEICSLNKYKIFKYKIRMVNKADGSINMTILFLNETRETVLEWKLKLSSQWLDRKDVRNTENQTYRESLNLRIEAMIKLIETENCSFDLPNNEEEFFTKILYN